MEEKKETQEKKPPVPPVKKSKPTTSTKRTVKATVKNLFNVSYAKFLIIQIYITLLKKAQLKLNSLEK